ncbi:MAG: phosphoribosylglycinamide formyltransferase [Armatimonadota bacterium]|nr:phosphoribosylglycinamide formyltransferase [Armatimonadota bacterium]MDW8289656.1 phosphoribosylglycinamide formyltransferase [Armatimonadota bacterium]
MSIRIAILVSGHGRGSNMAALIDACERGEIDGQVVLVIGTRGEAPALQRAAEKGVPTCVISPRGLDDEQYARRLLQALEEAQVDLVCLAGYMRLLPAPVVRAYAGRVMNIHPALLPLFGGKGMYGEHVHRAVLESGMKVSGCTVHFVDEHYDTGPIILQRCVPVEEDDTWESLAARVLEQEHQAYVQAVKLFAEGRLRLEGRRVRILPSSP